MIEGHKEAFSDFRTKCTVNSTIAEMRLPKNNVNADLLILELGEEIE